MQRIPKDVYSRCVGIAKSYYLLLARKREIEREILLSSPPPSNGMPKGGRISDSTGDKAERLLRRKAEIERKIAAIQAAMEALRDETEREFIRKNLFDRIPMGYFYTPMSIETCKRTRKRFIIHIAEETNEI